MNNGPDVARVGGGVSQNVICPPPSRTARSAPQVNSDVVLLLSDSDFFFVPSFGRSMHFDLRTYLRFSFISTFSTLNDARETITWANRISLGCGGLLYCGRTVLMSFILMQSAKSLKYKKCRVKTAFGMFYLLNERPQRAASSYLRLTYNILVYNNNSNIQHHQTYIIIVKPFCGLRN